MGLSMYAFEAIKSRIENLTGLAQPTAARNQKTNQTIKATG